MQLRQKAEFLFNHSQQLANDVREVIMMFKMEKGQKDSSLKKKVAEMKF